MKNNQVTVVGEVVTNFKFNHEVLGERFYESIIKISRLSEREDTIPFLVSERMVDVSIDYTGTVMEIGGEYRSWNKKVGERNELILVIFAMEMNYSERPFPGFENNRIELNGYLCKKPVYRKTPLGREVADCILAVNRAYGKSDYIPCVAWGRNARYLGDLNVGDNVRCVGRIQSRTYRKDIEGELVDMEAYEVSIASLEKVAADE